jgi:predicted AAA+ superfamily ATPase
MFDTALLNFWLDENNPLSNTLCHKILLTNEIYSQFQLFSQVSPELFYYSSSANSEIDLIVKVKDFVTAIKFHFSETEPSAFELRALKSFAKKYPKAQLLIFAPGSDIYKIDQKITVVPWRFIG